MILPLQAMCDRVEVFYECGKKSCLWAVLTLEQSSDRFQIQIKRALILWIEALASLLQEAGIEPTEAKFRAEEAILRIQGSLILARELNDTAPFKRTMQRLSQELLKETI